MRYEVVVTEEAERDASHFYDWIAVRSLSGAKRWLEAFWKAADELTHDAERHPRAAEAPHLSLPVRQVLFRTRQGNKYRIIFVIEEDRVIVLRIQGAGQPPLRNRDLHR
jgi:plasmid stabilization system protein ParE